MAKVKKEQEENTLFSVNDEVKAEFKNQVKGEITKEIIDDIKDDIMILVKEEVKSDIKEEIEDEIKKENKRIIRGKNRKLFFKNVFILILIGILGGLIYFMYKQGNFTVTINDNSNVKVNNSEIKEKSVETKEVVTEEVIDTLPLIDNMSVNLPLDNNNAFYLYNGTYKEDNINDQIKLNLSYKSVNKDEFTEEDMMKAYYSIFGTNDHYKSVSFNYECKHFAFNEDTKTFKLEGNMCLTLTNKEKKEEVLEYKEINDKLYVYTVLALYDKETNALYDYKNLYNPVAINLQNEYKLEDYKAYLSKFEYVFIKKDNKYYFTSITNK